MGSPGWARPRWAGRPTPCWAMIKDLEPLLLGADADRIEHLWQQAYRHAFWHGGPTFLSALAGVEVALWDIKGQALGRAHPPPAGRPGARPHSRLCQRAARRARPRRWPRRRRRWSRVGSRALKMAPWDAMPILASRGHDRGRRRQGARGAGGGRPGDRADGRCPRPALAAGGGARRGDAGPARHHSSSRSRACPEQRRR